MVRNLSNVNEIGWKKTRTPGKSDGKIANEENEMEDEREKNRATHESRNCA